MSKFVSELIEQYGFKKYEEQILKLVKPAIGMVKENTEEEEIPLGGTKMGGHPDFPNGIIFPKYEEQPLTFLCQINLSDVKSFDQENLLPEKGVLYFFFEALECPFGLDEEGIQNSWHVFFYDGDLSSLERTPYPYMDEELKPLPCFKLSFRTLYTIPDPFENKKMYPFLSDFEEEELDEIENQLSDLYVHLCNISRYKEEEVFGVIENEPMHYLLGHSFDVQGDAISDLIYQLHESEWQGLSFAQRDELIEKEKSDWTLLFQMDTDGDLEVMWGDSGMLYFCIKKEDLKNKKFENAYLVWQCC